MPNPMIQVTCASIKYAQDGKKPFVFIGTDGQEYKGWTKPGEVASPQPGQTYMVETYQNKNNEPVIGKMFAAGTAQPPPAVAALPRPPYVPQAQPSVPVQQYAQGSPAGDPKQSIIIAQVAVKAAVDIWCAGDTPADPFNDLDAQLTDLARQVVRSIYTIKGELDASH